MEVGVGQSVRGNAVDVGRLDQATPRLHRRKAHIVEHDVEHIRCALRRFRLGVRFPIGIESRTSMLMTPLKGFVAIVYISFTKRS